MITGLGKTLVYVLVVLSIVSLGLAFWLYVEGQSIQGQLYATAQETTARREAKKYQAELKAINDEIRKRLDALLEQENALWVLLDKYRATLSQARTELARLEEENEGLTKDKVTPLQGEVARLIKDVEEQRQRTIDALAIQTSLREEAEEPPDKSFRRQIAVGREDKVAAEAEQGRLRQPLFNAQVQLTTLENRHQELVARVKQLTEAKGAAPSSP